MLPCTKRRAPVHAGWTPLLPGAWGECRGWTPRQNPQGQRRHTVVRYARPPPLRRSLSPFSSLCSFLVAGIKGKLTFKEGGRSTLPAFGRRLSRDGVRGLRPPNKPLSWATAFRSLGRRNLFGSPRPAKSAWARLFAGEARCLNYFRSLTRENSSVRCLIFTARISSLLNPRKMWGLKNLKTGTP
ncbi:Uncharacterised protein [Yersinia enterocolitica]|nr:Uncharacterised protein [Yersinia enterocolitica]